MLAIPESAEVSASARLRLVMVKDVGEVGGRAVMVGL